VLTEREKAAFLLAFFEVKDEEFAGVAMQYVKMSEEEWSKFYNDFNDFLDSIKKKIKSRVPPRE
jgi:coenzyme F420-reducing hydrogenase delta subunit